MMTRLTVVAFLGLSLVAGCDGKKDKPAAASSAKASSAASLTAPKTPIKASQPFEIAWTGPNGENDYVDIVRSGRPQQVGDEVTYVRTSAGNPAKLTAPEQPGTYDVRYVRDEGDRKVVAHIAITVVQ